MPASYCTIIHNHVVAAFGLRGKAEDDKAPLAGLRLGLVAGSLQKLSRVSVTRRDMAKHGTALNSFLCRGLSGSKKNEGLSGAAVFY